MRIYITEVVSRDGFQAEPQFIPTAQKIELINQLSQAGYETIEVSSFASPKAIPMLADAEQVFAGIQRNPKVRYTALIPNLRGAERGIQAGVQGFNLVMSLSEKHNQANLRMSREDSYQQLKDVIKLAKQHQIPVSAGFSTSFGCTLQGSIPETEATHWVARFVDLGVDGISLSDTTGMANPNQVARLSEQILKLCTNQTVTLHFHNTRGMGLANVVAALQTGVRHFDASLGGLGGCPYAPGATGNISTEDTAHMLELMGWNTGLDIKTLLHCAKMLEQWIGRPLPSHLLKAGTVAAIIQRTQNQRKGDTQ